MPTNFASFLRVCCLRYLSMRTEKSASVADAMPELAASTNEARPRMLKTV
jgi:predicted DNA-binding ribbon-helix-helix protein